MKISAIIILLLFAACSLQPKKNNIKQMALFKKDLSFRPLFITKLSTPSPYFGNNLNLDSSTCLKDKNLPYPSYKDEPFYFNELGYCFFKNKRYKLSYYFFKKSVHNQKNFIPGLNNLGVLRLKQGYKQKALVFFLKAHQINPNSFESTYNLGSIYLEFGLLEKAKEVLSKFHTKNKSNAAINLKFITTLFLLNQFKKAHEIFKRTSRPTDPNVAKLYSKLESIFRLAKSPQT